MISCMQFFEVFLAGWEDTDPFERQIRGKAAQSIVMLEQTWRDPVRKDLVQRNS